MLEKLQNGDTATIGTVEWTKEECPELGGAVGVVRREVFIKREICNEAQIGSEISRISEDIAIRTGHIEALRKFATKSLQLASMAGDDKRITEEPAKAEPLKEGLPK
jgi:hypothetical protein